MNWNCNNLRKKSKRTQILNNNALIKKIGDCIDKSKISPNALHTLKILQKNNHKAYIVGGAVRDLLIGHKPKDFDVVTDAKPQTIRRLFRRSRIIGRRFKIVHIQYTNEIIECATFRALPNPKNKDEQLLVRDNTFGTENEDAIRRDFTINALFYDPLNDTIIDYTNGLKDIKNKKVKIIGDADISYLEDPVRMIRALKYSATTNFQIDKITYNRINKHSAEISKCAKARIIEEIYKILRSGNSIQIFFHFIKTKLLLNLIPDLYNHLKDNSKDLHSFKKTDFGKRMEILDELVNRNRWFSNHLFLLILFYDLLNELGDPTAEGEKVANRTKLQLDYLSKLAPEVGFSRKDKDLTIKAFSVQKKFMNHKKLSKNFLTRFVLRDYFKASLDFFEIESRVEKKRSDEILFWVNHYKKNLGTIKQHRQEQMRKTKAKNFRRNNRKN